MHEYRRGGLRLATGLLLAALLLSGCLERTELNPDELTFSLPTTLSIDVGQTLTGTGIMFESYDDGAVILVIDGTRAVKKRGDSVKWGGSIIPETEVELDLRVLWTSEDKVDLGGTAHVRVNRPTPEAGGLVDTSPVSYSGAVAYGIAKDSYIPGTTLTYLGPTEDGAELGGLFNEYAYRTIGDSILWEGSLRPGVFLRMELRTVQFDARGLRVAGVATLWLGE